MNNFELYSPTYFAFGRGMQAKIGALTRRFGGTKALLHFGGGSVVRSGLLSDVQRSLDEAGIAWVTLGGARPNPRSGLVYQGVSLCRSEGVDFVIGLGGGSAIDSAKAIAAGALYDGDFWDLFTNKAPYTDALPVGCVLTLPATGTESSNSAVITHEDGMLKYGLRGDKNRPVFAIMNPELTFTLPPEQTAYGIADMMAHVLERYMTNTQDVDVSDRLCEAVLQSILKAGPVAMREPNNYAARAELMWAGTLAHNGQLGVGREEDWGSHRIGTELSAVYDTPHGASLSIVMPQWMRYTLPGHTMRYAQFATRVFGCEMDFENPDRTALEGIDRLRAFFGSLNLPLTLADVGVPEDAIPMLAARTRFSDGVVGAFTPLRQDDVERVLRLCAK